MEEKSQINKYIDNHMQRLGDRARSHTQNATFRAFKGNFHIICVSRRIFFSPCFYNMWWRQPFTVKSYSRHWKSRISFAFWTIARSESIERMNFFYKHSHMKKQTQQHATKKKQRKMKKKKSSTSTNECKYTHKDI